MGTSEKPKRWKSCENVKCGCGHYPKDHHAREGSCEKCACTWYYPNDDHIKNKRKEKNENS